jgi:hypothetical protein
MVTLAPEANLLAVAEHQLVRTDDGSVLMTRPLRPCDADLFNRQWSERGVPTRWVLVELRAAG